MNCRGFRRLTNLGMFPFPPRWCWSFPFSLSLFYAVYRARTWVRGCGTSDWPVGGEWI